MGYKGAKEKMKKFITMIFAVMLTTTFAFAGGRTSCRIYGAPSDNAAALTSSMDCESNGKVSTEVYLEKNDLKNGQSIVIFVEAKFPGGRTETGKVEFFPLSGDRLRVEFYAKKDSGECVTFSISSASCKN